MSDNTGEAEAAGPRHPSREHAKYDKMFMISQAKVGSQWGALLTGAPYMRAATSKVSLTQCVAWPRNTGSAHTNFSHAPTHIRG